MDVVANNPAGSPWLAYALDLISGVLGLEDPLRPVSPDQVASDVPCIHYGDVSGGRPVMRLPRLEAWRPGGMRFLRIDCGDAGDVEALVYAKTVSGAVQGAEAPLGADVFFNVFAYASCLEERLTEQDRRKSAHSYALRLTGDGRRFDRPYANYLILAFAQSLKRALGKTSLGRSRTPAIYLSHDIDAIRKTGMTRLKEGAFRGFNAVRNGCRGRFRAAVKNAVETARFMASSRNYLGIAELAAMEEKRDFTSAYNVYAGGLNGHGMRSRINHVIFNPAYDIQRSRDVSAMLRRLSKNGWEVGAHFGFDSWGDAGLLRAERRHIQEALPEHDVISSRNHWLRFSLQRSWRLLEEVGIKIDTTLGFNDRPGFRAGLATPFKPYCFQEQRALDIMEVPFMLMDTHLYYYNLYDESQRRRKIVELLRELKAVSGSAGVIWHTHVLSRDHGWGDEYAFMMDEMRRLGLESRLPKDALCLPGETRP